MADGWLEGRFVIQFNDSFIVKPEEDDRGGDDLVSARLGDRTEAAVFTLKDGWLFSDEKGAETAEFRQPWIMGRNALDRDVPGPKHLYWLQDRRRIQRCQSAGPEDSPIIEFESILISLH